MPSTSRHLAGHFTCARLLRFAFPMIGTVIFTSVYSIVDGFFVSNWIGKEALAGINLVYPFSMLLAAFGVMVGAGENGEVRGILKRSLAILGATGGAMALSAFLLADPLAKVFTGYDEYLLSLTLLARFGGLPRASRPPAESWARAFREEEKRP